MRYSRHWYIVPFLTHLVLLFSASWLIDIIEHNVMWESAFPLPDWMLFATVAICAPSSLAISRLLADPSIGLAFGGLLTSAGLLWTWFETGPLQMISFCVITGAGISFSLQVIGVALSPYFIRENVTAAVGTLILSVCGIMILCPLMRHPAVENNNIFLYLCPVALISSLVPLMVYLHSLQKSSKDKPEKMLLERHTGNISTLSENFMKNDCETEIHCCGNAGNDVQHSVSSDGWAMSVISLLVWLTWGAGVDTTWLCLGWRYQYFSTPTGLSSLQLILCFLVLALKMWTDFLQPSTSLCRVNLASNYMQLCLLGTGGVILCLFPEYMQAFNNHLLFTAGFALQYDDFSDLYLVRRSSLPTSIFKYKLITYQIALNEEKNKKCSPLLTICCRICHMLCLLLMSILAIILGLQIANLLGYLSTLPPLSFVCSRNGLMVMSVAAICISLLRPNLYIGRKHHIMAF